MPERPDPTKTAQGEPSNLIKLGQVWSQRWKPCATHTWPNGSLDRRSHFAGRSARATLANKKAAREDRAACRNARLAARKSVVLESAMRAERRWRLETSRRYS